MPVTTVQHGYTTGGGYATGGSYATGGAYSSGYTGGYSNAGYANGGYTTTVQGPTTTTYVTDSHLHSVPVTTGGTYLQGSQTYAQGGTTYVSGGSGVNVQRYWMMFYKTFYSLTISQLLMVKIQSFIIAVFLY